MSIHLGIVQVSIHSLFRLDMKLLIFIQSGSCSIIFEGTVLSGDTLFAGNYGRTDLPVCIIFIFIYNLLNCG